MTDNLIQEQIRKISAYSLNRRDRFRKSYVFSQMLQLTICVKHSLFYIPPTTGAWILTPGSHTGVYSMVGSAVKDHIDTAGSSAMNDIVLLGIASWGSVASRDKLECPKVGRN